MGVGQDGDDDHALAAMGEPEVGGTQPGSLHLVTGVLQSPASDVQAPPKESGHVLPDDSDGLEGSDEVEHVEPETSSGALDATTAGVGGASRRVVPGPWAGMPPSPTKAR